MGGELHHRGQPRGQGVATGLAQRESGTLPDSNIGHGPREYAGRFPFRMRSSLGGVVTFDGRSGRSR
jgi:hypothetical protein